jgi:SAM-dependent methyltransferase
MRTELYHQTYSVQATHWWMRSRRKLSIELLTRFGVPAGCSHLDIGCGPGQNLGLLDHLNPSRVVGIDVSPIALELAHKGHPRADLIRANINNSLPFRDEVFDVATIFGVVCSEWVESDVAVLREARRVLKPNGLLLITEPAFPALFRQMDVIGMVKRRYRLRQFVEMLRSASLDVVLSSYFTSVGAPIILAMKALTPAATKTSIANDVPDLRPMHPWLNAASYGVAQLEAALIKAGVPIPFGTTIICVAKRK